MDAEIKMIWAEAYDRAEEDIECRFIDVISPIRYEVKGYQVIFLGPNWWDWSCNCRGGNHPTCKHRAAVSATVCGFESASDCPIYPWEDPDNLVWPQHLDYSKREGVPIRGG